MAPQRGPDGKFVSSNGRYDLEDFDDVEVLTWTSNSGTEGIETGHDFYTASNRVVDMDDLLDRRRDRAVLVSSTFGTTINGIHDYTDVPFTQAGQSLLSTREEPHYEIGPAESSFRQNEDSFDVVHDPLTVAGGPRASGQDNESFYEEDIADPVFHSRDEVFCHWMWHSNNPDETSGTGWMLSGGQLVFGIESTR